MNSGDPVILDKIDEKGLHLAVKTGEDPDVYPGDIWAEITLDAEHLLDFASHDGTPEESLEIAALLRAWATTIETTAKAR